MSWKDDPIVAAPGGWQDDPIVEPPGERTVLQQLGRQAGLTARYVTEGLAAVPGIFIDPFQKAYHAATPPGANLSSLVTGRAPQDNRQTFTQAVSSGLDAIGLPRPDGALENVVGAVSRAAVGGAPLVKAAQATVNAGKWAPELVRQIASRPGAELASNAIGGGAGETAKEMGAGPTGQLLASAIAPVAVAPVAAAVKGAGRAAQEGKNAITQYGVEQIVADALGKTATNRPQALRNLEQYVALKAAEREGKLTVGVPGASPEAAAVAADYGLMQGRNAVARGDAKPLFNQQWAQNNKAYLEDLAKLNATKTEIDRLMVKRDAITAPLRERVFANSTLPVDVDALQYRIVNLMEKPIAQGQAAQTALGNLFNRLEKAKTDGTVSAEHLYNGLHKDIGEMVGRGIESASGRIRLSSGLAAAVKRDLADEIEKVAPGFRKYLETYARLSKPIDRKVQMTKLLGGQKMKKVANAAILTDGVTAEHALSQAKFGNAVDAMQEKLRLAPRQSDILNRVRGALDAETSLAGSGRVASGSDTYQNMAAANFVNRVLGEGLASTSAGRLAGKPIDWLTKPFDTSRRIQDLQVRAYQDPELMLRLLSRARTTRERPTVAGLTDLTAQRQMGGLFGGLLGFGQ